MGLSREGGHVHVDERISIMPDLISADPEASTSRQKIRRSDNQGLQQRITNQSISACISSGEDTNSSALSPHRHGRGHHVWFSSVSLRTEKDAAASSPAGGLVDDGLDSKIGSSIAHSPSDIPSRPRTAVGRRGPSRGGAARSGRSDDRAFI